MKILRAITLCSTFIPDCRYDKRNIRLIGNVCYPHTLCSGILCGHKNTFPSLGRSVYQCPQCQSTCQVRNVHFEQEMFRFPWSQTDEFTFFKRRKKQFKMLLAISIVQHVPTKSVFNYQPTKTLVSTNAIIAKPALTGLMFSSRNWNQH